MSIAKAVVTGTVYRAAEKRYTQNDVAVSSFVLNIGTRDELLIRVISKRKILDELVSSLEKNDKVLVEGRLQIATVQSGDGAERRIYEIDANTIEKMSGGSASYSNPDFGTSENIVSFGSDDSMSNELIGEEEIPF